MAYMIGKVGRFIITPNNFDEICNDYSSLGIIYILTHAVDNSTV